MLPRSSGTPLLAQPALLGVLVILVLGSGCANLATKVPDIDVAGPLSAVNGTQPLVPAVPGWDAGFLTPFVNLWSGNLFVEYKLVEVAAIGFPWRLRLYYNSAKMDEVGVLGPGWRHSYEIALRVGQPTTDAITVVWGDGREDVFVDDGSGWAGPASLLGRRITSITGGYRLRTKHGLTYDFNLAGLLIALRDRSGNETALAYDAFDRLDTITDASGRTLVFAYAGDRLSQISGSLLALAIAFSYTDGKLASVSNPQGFSSSFTYSGNALESVTDPDLGSVIISYYDSDPWPVKIVKCTAADNVVEAQRTFEFDAATTTTTVKDSLDAARQSVTTYALDSQGLCTSVTDGPLGTATTTYASLTNVIASHTDADGHTTTWGSDALGNVTSETDAMGNTATIAFESTFNLPVSVTDKRGKVWVFDRDPGTGVVLRARDPLGNEVEYGYSSQGLVVSVEDQRGGVTTLGRDPNGDVVSVLDPAGQAIAATRNVRGAILSVTDADGRTTAFARNDRDEATTVTLSNGGTYIVGWTGSGKVASVEDPTLALVSLAYDARKLVRERTDALGGVVQLRWDGGGFLVEWVDELGRAETRTLDVAGRVLSQTDADGGTWTHSYTCCDLASTTSPVGVVTTYVRDSLHRLVSRISGPDVQANFSWNENSTLVAAELVNPPEPTLREEYTVDDAGRRIGIVRPDLGRTVVFGLSPTGRVETMSDNLRGGVCSVVRDARDQAISVHLGISGALVAIARTARREIDRIDYPGGVSSDFAHDDLGSVASIANLWPAGSATYAFVRDLRGDMTHADLNTPATGVLAHDVAWDGNGRPLLEAYPPAAPTSYSHDAVGNRTSLTVPPAPLEPYTYSGADRLATFGVSSATWDADGICMGLSMPGTTAAIARRSDGMPKTITVNGQTWTLFFDMFGRLARVKLPSGQEEWSAFDVADGGVLRESVHPGAGLAPTDELFYLPEEAESRTDMPVALSGESVPIAWTKTPFASVANVRATLVGLRGIGQVVDGNGAFLSAREHTLFDKVLASVGAAQPSVGAYGTKRVANLNDFSFTKAIDKSAPRIWSVCLNGENLKSAMVQCRKAGNARAEFLNPNLSPLVDPKILHATTGSFLQDAGPGTDGLFGNEAPGVLVSLEPYRPPRITRSPIVMGSLTAVVGGASGEEIYSDDFGRVKVRFHWDRYGRTDETNACWIRVTRNWANDSPGATLDF
jgi:YD repeat-containing protein